MITQKDKSQIDQFLEDTFPQTHLPSTHPNGEHDGAAASCGSQSTSESPDSKSSAGAATAPAALAPKIGHEDTKTQSLIESSSLGALVALPRADQIMELGRMRECVNLLKEEIEAGWQRIIAEQQRLGWPDFDLIQDATHALHRATMDLDNVTHEMVCKLRWRPQTGTDRMTELTEGEGR